MGADYAQYPFPKGKHPLGWLETTVGEVMLEIRNGYSSGKHNQTGQGIPHLRPMNVSPDGEISMEDVLYVSPSAGGLRLAKDDVLFTNTSSTLWVGKTALVEKSGDWGFSNHMTRMRVADGMSPEFVARQLHYLCMSGYFAIHCTKYINQSSMAGTQLAKSVPFRVPPAEEQNRIVTKLRRLLARERKLRRELEALPDTIQQYRIAVLEAACTGRLVPTEAELAQNERRTFEPAPVLIERILVERRAKWESDQLAKIRATNKELKDDKWKERYTVPRPPDFRSQVEVTLPEGWAWCSFHQVLDVERGRFAARPRNDPKLYNGKYPFVQIGDLPVKGGLIHRYNQTLNEKGFEVSKLFPKGTVLVAIVGATIGNTGVLGFDSCCPDSLVAFQSSDNTLLRYTDYYLRLKRLEIRRAATGSGGQPNINLGILQPWPMALPPIAEQLRIIAEVDRRFASLDAIEAQLALARPELSHMRWSLFHCAMSGELVRQKRSDEPARKFLSRIRKFKDNLAKQPKVRAVTQPPLKLEKLPMLSLEDITSAHLADILREKGGPLDAKTLWKESQLTIDDFYAQLKKELGKSLRETGKDRLLEVKS
jgi:type I restriction enzyme S subunit